MSLQVTGVITPALEKTFWPEVSTIFDVASIDAQLTFYITRAEILVNVIGPYNLSDSSYAVVMPMAFKLLVKRLVNYDVHPAQSAEANGVIAESVRGVSYTRSTTPLSINDLLGPEVKEMLGLLLSPDAAGIDFTVAISDILFFRPILQSSQQGNTQGVFDSTLDDRVVDLLHDRILGANLFGVPTFGVGGSWWQQQ